jgi:type III pantothenate kinase
MLLTIDIGNTNVTIGLYVGQELAAHWRLATDHQRMPDEYGLVLIGLLEHRGYRPEQVEAVAMASVVPPLTSSFAQCVREYIGCEPLIVDARLRTGVIVRYDDPAAVGADRIVEAAAVPQLYGGPACIVDFGTATTFDAISAEGDYLGGAIAPGLGISAEALFQRAAKLPKVELQRPPSPIGRNTVHSIQSGLLFGYVGMVEGMVARFRAELGPTMKVIGTGGLAEIIARETDVIEIIAPWLTLEGLRIVWELNGGPGTMDNGR